MSGAEPRCVNFFMGTAHGGDAVQAEVTDLSVSIFGERKKIFCSKPFSFAFLGVV